MTSVPAKHPNCQLYLISPPDVGGSFPERLARVLDVLKAENPGAAFQFGVKGIDQHEAGRLAGPLQEICAAHEVAFIVNAFKIVRVDSVNRVSTVQAVA